MREKTIRVVRQQSQKSLKPLHRRLFSDFPRNHCKHVCTSVSAVLFFISQPVYYFIDLPNSAVTTDELILGEFSPEKPVY